MKLEVFNKYVDNIIDLYRVDKQDLFTNTKRRDIVEPRHLLYYLCKRRGISFPYLKIYMNMNNYKINYSSYKNAIEYAENRIAEDEDYLYVVKKIENSVFI